MTVHEVELEGASVVAEQLRVPVSASALGPPTASASAAEAMIAMRAIRPLMPWRVGVNEEVISDAVLLVSGAYRIPLNRGIRARRYSEHMASIGVDWGTESDASHQ